MGWTRRSAAISVLLVLEEQRKRAGQRVVQLREAQGWSQETLANKAGLSVKTVSRFENGIHEGRNETVRKLAKALKVNEVDVTGPPPAPLGLGAHEDDGESQLDRVERQQDEILATLTGLAAALKISADVQSFVDDWREGRLPGSPQGSRAAGEENGSKGNRAA